MIFEKGWFLRKMNRYAPYGYTFVASGDDGRIAMCSKKIMGNQAPHGSFISCFSFNMLDSLYGGLITRRSGKICQGATAGEYITAYDITRANVNLNDKVADAKHEIYRSIARDFLHVTHRPYPLLMKRNAILIQGLQDASVTPPTYLAKRLQKYVNNCTWYAIERVLSSMPICDLRYYQEQYRNKMAELGIEFGRVSTLTDIDKIAFKKRSEQLTQNIEDQMYDVLPRQEKSMQRALAKETPSDKLQQLQKQVDITKKKIDQMKKERKSLEPVPTYMPARKMMPDLFFKNGAPSVPQFHKNPFRQMLQLAFIQVKNTNQK